jgi:NADH dehydrogenase
MQTKRVIIIGAGYGGIKALLELYSCQEIEILLIERNSYHYLQTDVYDYIASQITLSDIAIDLYTFCASFGENVTFIHEEVLRVDFIKNKVITHKNHYIYDFLILASGAQTLLPASILGLKKNFHGIKSLENALLFKQKFEYFIYKKIKEEGRCSLDSNFNIIIAGGGLSGVEIASEMANYAKEFYKDTAYLCSSVNITLVSSTQNLLASNSVFMRQYAELRLANLNIKIIKGTRITKVEDDAVYLNDGRKLNMNFLIWTAGITSSDLVLKMQVAKNRKEQLEVDEFFRLKEYKNVFAIGDNAALFDPTSKIALPPTAQSAELSATYVASNLKRIIKNQSLHVRQIKLQGFFTSLGGKYGCGELMGLLKLKGPVAYIFKKMIEILYRIPLQKRCRQGLKRIRKI